MAQSPQHRGSTMLTCLKILYALLLVLPIGPLANICVISQM